MQSERSLTSMIFGAAGLLLASLPVPAMAQAQPAETAEAAAVAASADDSGDDNAAGDPDLWRRIVTALGFGPGAETQPADQTRTVATPEPAADAAPPVRAVDLLRPADRRESLQRSFFGRVVARETADLAFPLSGTLTRFPVEEGVVVPQGAVLAALDLDPFERAVERAEIQLEQAERNYARAVALKERNVGSLSRAEDAETARDLADVALREARDALEDATMRAPYRALIAERLTANHVIVAPGTPIVRVHDISQMRVEIDIPERLVQRVPDINQVSFTASLPGRDDPVPLRLVEFQAETEAVGQSYRFSLALPAISARTLLPGNSLTVTGRLPEEATDLIVPASAIAADETRTPYVMVFEPAGADEGRVHALPVEVSSADGTHFAVSGLSPEAEIVAVGAHLLRDGQKVRRYTGLKMSE